MIADVEERRLVVAQADRVSGVLAPVRQQVVALEVAQHGAVDVGAGDAGTKRIECRPLGGDGVVEEAPHLVCRRADHHRPLELGVVAPHRCSGLRDEHVALLELDVVRDRVRPGAAPPDLPAIAGLHAVGRSELAAEGIAERLQHRERRFAPRTQARLRLCHARAGVFLQQAVCVCAPARALSDESDLGLALPRDHALDQL